MAWDGRNRRKFPRVVFPCLIKIRRGNDLKEVLLTHTQNLSIGGVRVILKMPIDLGVTIDVEIDLLDTNEHLKCRGKVVWLDRRKSDNAFKPNFYDVGVEFAELDETDKKRLDRIVAHHLKQGHQD